MLQNMTAFSRGSEMPPRRNKLKTPSLDGAKCREAKGQYSLFFPFYNCCVSGAKTKTRSEYTEVKQEDSMDDIAEEKPDLEKSEGKSQWALSAIKLVVTSLLSETRRYLLYILSHFFQLQMSRRGVRTVFLTARQLLPWT